MTLIWIFLGIVCLLIWPLLFTLRYSNSEMHLLKRYALLFSPAAALLGIYLFWVGQQQVVHSHACGVVKSYQSYMTSGNKNKRKPFERVEILFDQAQHSRYLRFNEATDKVDVGKYICFEFSDRKLNSHLKDSMLIRWLQ